MSPYYKKFIPNFSEICAPPTNLTKKYSRFIWTKLETNDSIKLKELLSYFILIYSNFSEHFKLHSDSSDQAIGAVITQEIDEVDKPIANFSRKLSFQGKRLIPQKEKP